MSRFPAGEINRRTFVSVVAAGAALARAPGSLAALPEAHEPFSFLLLGDTHFDRIEHHDLDWLRANYAKDIPQVENYCRHTRDVLPKLLVRARETLLRTTSPAAFALHVGDLVEGICGNAELAERHCVEGWAFFRQANLGVPLLMTKGNHDVTGPGAVEAFEKVLLGETARELGRNRLERTSYAFQRGENLFVAFDAYDRTAIDWLEETVAAHDFRRLFVLVHMPVVPYNARSSWRVYDSPRLAEQRTRLVELLGRHRAIVLCGHLHKESVLVRRCESGKFVQLALSSVVKSSTNQRRLEGVGEYGPDLVDLEPTFSPDTVAARRRMLADEQPFVEHFEYSDTAGFAIVEVDGAEVLATIHEGADETSMPRTISLSELLA